MTLVIICQIEDQWQIFVEQCYCVNIRFDFDICVRSNIGALVECCAVWQLSMFWGCALVEADTCWQGESPLPGLQLGQAIAPRNRPDPSLALALPVVLQTCTSTLWKLFEHCAQSGGLKKRAKNLQKRKTKEISTFRWGLY